MSDESQNKTKKRKFESNFSFKDALSALGSKIPPHSNESEMAVLGAMIMNRAAISKVIELIDEDSFYNDAHKHVYIAIKTMFERNSNVDLISLAEQLSKSNALERIGGAVYLANIEASTPTSANVETHARIIQEKYLKRELIKISGQIMSESYDDSTDALEEIDRAENIIFQLAQKRFQKGYVSVKAIAKDTMDLLHSLIEKENKGITGVPSGFHELDNKFTGGFQRSDLIIVAARPSMGKTAFALSVARNVAVQENIPVAFFSIEMAAIQLVIRLLSAESKLNGNNIRTGNINQNDMKKINSSIDRIAYAPIYIDDSPSLTILELRAKTRRLIAEHGVQMVMVDYLQLIKSPKAESREREISIISQSLKQLAKELNIPVIALAQLNRSLESRQDKRPMLSDLRESGSIEQDADVVIFIHRPEHYKIEKMDNDTSSEGKAEIILGKQRNGPTGSVVLAYQKDYARFENLQYDYQEPPDDMEFPNDLPEDYSDDAPF